MNRGPHVQFWDRVLIGEGCWHWLGSTNRSNANEWYGYFAAERAHRRMYREMVGPLERGLVVDHICCNTLCVRPDHLQQVTPRVNTLRGYGPTSVNSTKEHCPRGHPYDYQNRSGGRWCRTCKNASTRALYWRKKRQHWSGGAHLEVIR